MGRRSPDVHNLVQLVLRRCRGCSADYHYAVAEQFLGAEDKFDASTHLAVLDGVRRRVKKPPAESPPWDPAAGSTICGECHKRFADHPVDPQNPWLQVLCNGKRVKL